MLDMPYHEATLSIESGKHCEVDTQTMSGWMRQEGRDGQLSGPEGGRGVLKLGREGAKQAGMGKLTHNPGPRS